MPANHCGLQIVAAAIAFAAVAAVSAAQLPLEPQHNSGTSITAAFEGWYPNEDGTFTILLGYFNRNLREPIDIPVGPDNHVDPGGPDQAQPTHFLPGRQWGVFTITVPKDFGQEKKITWTITANGKTTTLPVNLNPLYVVAPFIDATGNTPPFIGFQAEGSFVQGPPRKIANSLKATAGSPLPLTIWVADDAKLPPSASAGAGRGRRGNRAPVSVIWSKFRGPGDVKFSNDRPPVEKAEFKAPPPATYTGKSDTSATFSQPGEYILEVVANDYSGFGGGGFQCCWTTAQVKVSVQGAGAPAGSR